MTQTAVFRRPLFPSIRRLTALLVLALASATGVAADPIRYATYDSFTLYKADPGPLKDDVLFVFHGFGSAVPNGAYKRVDKVFRQHYSVIGFNYDYFDFAANDAFMDQVWTEILKDRNVTFVGTSLGGFWANYYAQIYGVTREILVNPAVDPAEQLKQFIGILAVEKRNQVIDVTAEAVESYRARTVAPQPGIDRLVILSRDDAVLDYRLAERAYDLPDTTMLIFDDGGHTVDMRQARYLDAIGAFLKTDG
ncbi:YqiA/YcfP family alpha/beta fold hydrolase [Chachezhania sediminis]|uniref:YqiA/YcfP family alpha/beta fold hydrolase n=1 Tax=Chachezhania sediminis TaxID=2599291 RepID=UPI00131B726B|nr:YqiA/YcfP family alpha/beta fold hydrolase [Chachezhania sediminis]